MSGAGHRNTPSLHRFRDAVGTRLWPLPVLGILIAAGLGVAVPEVDGALAAGSPDDATQRFATWLSQWTFSGGADAARDVLAAIAGSIITVTALTFSLTVVTLQLASSQFSPRLLRTFSADRFVQVTLAAFLGTFVYTLTVLRTVRVETDTAPAIVPHAAITLAYLAAVVDVVLLVVFLGHLAREIRVETMLARVHRGAEASLRAAVPRRDDDSGPPAPMGVPPAFDTDDPAWRPLTAGGSGFVTGIDHDDLVEVADRFDLLLDLHCEPGSAVAQGAPLGRWRVAPGTTHDDSVDLRERSDAVRKAVSDAVRTGVERTSAQDIGFGLRQLVDVALKALSPGINDPTTAVHAVGHVSTLLCQYARYHCGPLVLRGDQDRQRVVVRRTPFAGLLDLGISQVMHYGSEDADVLVRVVDLLAEVGWVVEADDRPAVEGQLDRLCARVADANLDDIQRARVEQAIGVARDRLAHRVRPYRTMPTP